MLRYAVRTKTIPLPVSELLGSSSFVVTTEVVSLEAEAKCLLRVFREVFVRLASLSAT